jgi:hypothetical protein
MKKDGSWQVEEGKPLARALAHDMQESQTTTKIFSFHNHNQVTLKVN